MILIADSGSTKTSWALTAPGSTLCDTLVTAGMNPLTSEASQLAQHCDVVRQWVGERRVDAAYFYGAGCGTLEARQLIASHLQRPFPSVLWHIGSDLEGACRAALGHKAGMVGILGTGSNACLFDGQTVTRHLPSLGYLLGDEGSGNHIGRLLLKGYFEERMPQPLRNMLSEEYHLEYKEVIHHIYHQSNPNAYLAQFAPFARSHRDNAFIANLLHDVFQQYLHHLVQPLGCQELHLVGSIAYHFHEEILDVAGSMGISVSSPILQSPISGLIAHFQTTR